MSLAPLCDVWRWKRIIKFTLRNTDLSGGGSRVLPTEVITQHLVLADLDLAQLVEQTTQHLQMLVGVIPGGNGDCSK